MVVCVQCQVNIHVPDNPHSDKNILIYAEGLKLNSPEQATMTLLNKLTGSVQYT